MEGTKNHRGLIRRTFSELFEIISDRKGSYSYEMNVSIVEIYNEQIRDLLSKNGKQKVEIRENSDKEVLKLNLSKHKVKNYEKIEKYLSDASYYRATGETDINSQSSRSHLILTVNISGTNHELNKKFRGKLNLIDLAGSERIEKSNAEGERKKEAMFIN